VTDTEQKPQTAAQRTALALRVARDNLLVYTRLCDPRYIVGRVHRYLAAKFLAVANGKCRRLIVNMPPQHGKSRLTAVEFATWMLGRDPRLNIVLTSYSGDLAKDRAGEARDRLASETYKAIFDTRLAYRWQPRSGWRTHQGGSYRAVGRTGGLTGRPCDVLIIDDPHADFADANSPTQREAVWQWYLSTAFTRLSPTGIVVVIMTRWHTDDLVGRLTDPKRVAELIDAGQGDAVFEVVNLPALAKETDLLGRQEGDALFPERYPVKRLQEIRATQTSFLWSALYDGSPVPLGGHYIDSRHFNVVGADEVPADLFWVRYWDLATDEKEISDYTASVQLAIDERGAVWIRSGISGQWLWPKARGMIKTIAETERCIVGIEAVAGFKTAYQNAREVVPSDIMLVEIGVDKDKLTRALEWIALTENRKTYIVRGDWVTSFFAECEQFPVGAHDDMVDAVSGAYAMAKHHRREIWVA
jgi:predicted phage terminase large subunit-like protein